MVQNKIQKNFNCETHIHYKIAKLHGADYNSAASAAPTCKSNL